MLAGLDPAAIRSGVVTRTEWVQDSPLSLGPNHSLLPGLRWSGNASSVHNAARRASRAGPGRTRRSHTVASRAVSPYSRISHSPAIAAARPRPVRQCTAIAPPPAASQARKKRRTASRGGGRRRSMRASSARKPASSKAALFSGGVGSGTVTAPFLPRLTLPLALQSHSLDSGNSFL
jgi:hypothetical protein